MGTAKGARAVQNRFREEVLNVVLAELLETRGLVSVPEGIRSTRHGTRLPDVTIADLFGVPFVIEGRIFTAEPVRETLLADTRQRVEEGLTRLALAVLYPPRLRTAADLPQLRAAMDSARLVVRVVSEESDGEWIESDVDGIVAILRRGYELVVTDDVVSAAVADLDAAIDVAARHIAAAPAATERLRVLLGIPTGDDDSDDEEADD